jgi:hypothetical protein
MADTKFMSFAEATPGLSDSVLVANVANGVRRATLEKLKEAIGTGGSWHNLQWNGCVCLGSFLGGMILQWGHVESKNVVFREEDGWQRLRIPYNIVFPKMCVYREAHYSWENSQPGTAQDFFVGGNNEYLEIDVPLNTEIKKIGLEWFAIGC